MPDPTGLTEEQLQEIEARNEAARKMVVALCKPENEAGARRWIMSIPARRDYDPDLVIGDALRDQRKLRAAVRALGEQLTAADRLAEAVANLEWVNVGTPSAVAARDALSTYTTMRRGGG